MDVVVKGADCGGCTVIDMADAAVTPGGMFGPAAGMLMYAGDDAERRGARCTGMSGRRSRRPVSPHVVEVEDADHGMRVPGPLAESIAVLARVVAIAAASRILPMSGCQYVSMTSVRQDAVVIEEHLLGGNDGGAVRIGETVRRVPGPWTPAVHALLRHLHDVGFDRAPRALGFDDQGREVLSFLPGTVVGTERPWPSWVHSDEALCQVARWLRDFHTAVAGFVPPSEAIWREGALWRPGLIIGHNDAAPYNAAWSDGRLVGFFDWDFAGPVTAEWDLAFTAFGWVPLHARHVVAAEGFTDFADRPRRLRLFLDTYGWDGPAGGFIAIVRQRVSASARGIRRAAENGDPTFARMIEYGIDATLQTAVDELADFPTT